MISKAKEFDNGCFSLKLIEQISKKQSLLAIGKLIPVFAFESIEVIGNIHEK